MSRRAIIIGLCILLVVTIGCIVAWTLWSNVLRSDYTEKTAVFKNQASQELAQKITSLKDAQGSASTRAILANLANSANELKGRLPIEPTILGVNITAKDAKERQQQVIDKATALAAELNKSQEILAYQEKMLPILKGVQAKTGKNLEELKALPLAWQSAIDSVKSIQPVDKTSAFHTAMVSGMESIKATLDTLPALFEKKDTAGFAAKQKELESKVAGLRESHHLLADITAQHDWRLSDVYRELQRLLQ